MVRGRGGPAPEPDSRSGREQHDEDEQSDPPRAVPASPAPRCDRRQNVERHASRVATSAVGSWDGS
jgi:hypothetical protein